MRLAILLAASLALAALALPVASAGHTWQQCMYGTWDPSAPPGWQHYCDLRAWADHKPVVPLVDCLLDPIIIVGYDVEEGLACLA